VTVVPRLLVLTDRHRCAQSGRDLPSTVARALDAGAPAVLYREKDLDGADRQQLGVQVAEVVRRAGAELFVASDGALGRVLDAQGLHLAATDPVPEPRGSWTLGRSCHDRAEVVAADAETLDYLTVSPAYPTASKPGYGPALGVDGVAELAAATTLPVLALGGIGVEEARALTADGGVHGVAVMGAVMGAADPATTVHDLLETLGGP
jgi:thiamine-phosphate diphosphorylase